MELKISVLSKPGSRAVNEDAYGMWSSPTACFCVLSDGAGGHAGGAAASKLAVQHVLDWFYKNPDTGPESLAAALKSANLAIAGAQLRSPEWSGMRATILVLAVDTSRATARWAHIGDTRLYCFRHQRIIAQTRDHSVVQNMVDAGYLEQKNLRASPNRNALLAALGDADHFEPAIELPDFPIRHGDVFLLCTDGFWEHFEETELERLLGLAQSPEAWMRELQDQVHRQNRANQDNYSALLVSCADPDDTTRMPAAPASDSV